MPLHSCVAAVRSLRVLSDAAALLRGRIKRVRCLALGSPALEPQAQWQLALLVALAAELGVADVTLHDPCFTAADVALIEGEGLVVAQHPPDPEGCLYYMPHAPRSLMEQVVREQQPRWILGNDVRATQGALDARGFWEKYPLLATLVHLSAPPQTAETVYKRVRPRRSKYTYVEREVPYEHAYFSGVDIHPLAAAGPWHNAFSDLALNCIRS